MADTSAEPDRRLSGGRLAAAFAVLGVALVGLSVWAGFLVDQTYTGDTRTSDIQAVQSVARRVATNFYSISYQSFDQDTQRVYADLSNTFKDEAVQQLGTSWKQTVVSNQLVSHAVVAASGVINISAKSAEVLVTVKRTSQSTQVKSPVSSWASAQVQLAKTGGRWRVSGMGGLQ
ncbi:MAG: hypothetical protein JWR24_3652 [Actinoallomurus sp.]|nr:hypothetical protein [Actinoallomurus sp.]